MMYMLFRSSIALFLLLLVSCTERQRRDPEPTPQPMLEAARPVPAFDGESAFGFLTAQTDFGPRNPGSPGHRRCLDYLVEQMRRFAEAVNTQEFSGGDFKGNRYRLTNVVASFNLGARDRILLSAHWDTRPWADEDPNPANHSSPILGANDGASGVAVLLEVARVLHVSPPPLGVDIVFFDGEDLGTHGDDTYWSQGAKHFARNRPPGFNPRFGINVDMVGDALLEIPREPNSQSYAPHVMNFVFGVARRLGIHQFVDRPGRLTYDDHIPLNEAGIRTINLIDFDYPDESNRYWHTLQDTPDKCSPQSLSAVGRVLLHIIYSGEQLP